MEPIIERITDPLYWINSLPAIVITLVVFWVLSQIIAMLVGIWNRIIQFFQATEVPTHSAHPGPSAYQRLLNCLFSIFLVIFLMIAVVGVAYVWIGL